MIDLIDSAAINQTNPDRWEGVKGCRSSVESRLNLYRYRPMSARDNNHHIIWKDGTNHPALLAKFTPIASFVN
jgi:hypothetical protein